ncbi:MAG: hypothetical protein GY719_19340 [bacterium]|nr:hypothetical protein [bacterium]
MEQEKRKKLGGFDKVLIGCGIGCAGLILVSVLGLAFGTMWLFTPGEQLATDVIVNEESLGVIRMHELAEDPGTQELLTQVLLRVDEANRKRQREELPESMRWLSDLQGGQSNPAGLNMLIPKEMTIAYEESEDGDGVDYVVALNPRTMVRMFKSMFSLMSSADDTEEVRADYRGHDVYRFEENAHLGFVDSTVVFASSRRAMERAVDRIEVGDVTPAQTLTSSIPEGEWDVEGTVGNETGLLDALLEGDAEIGEDGKSPEAPVADEDLAMSFGLDVVSADQITGLTVLVCEDRAAAERWLPVIEERYRTMAEKATEKGLRIETETRAEQNRVVTQVRLQGVEQMLVEALAVDTLEEEDLEEEDLEEEDWEEEIEEGQAGEGQG